jgi:hypothetical protein
VTLSNLVGPTQPLSAPLEKGPGVDGALSSAQNGDVMAARKRGHGPDLTTRILVQIRDEMRGIRDEVRGTNERLDQTNERVAALERRQTESEMRIATALVDVGGTLREVRDLLRDDMSLRPRIEDHESRLAALESARE